MKKILCFLTRRFASPPSGSGFLSKHGHSCPDCQSFFQDIHSLEQDLRVSPPPHDEKLCQDIMRSVRLLEAEKSPKSALVIPRWLPLAGLATVITVLLALKLKNPEEPTPPVADLPDSDPVMTETEGPEEPLIEEPLIEEAVTTVASLVEQQKLLRRDAQKLGHHLRERVILFQSTD